MLPGTTCGQVISIVINKSAIWTLFKYIHISHLMILKDRRRGSETKTRDAELVGGLMVGLAPCREADIKSCIVLVCVCVYV